MAHHSFISTQHDFEALITRALRTDAVGIDTEFVWERTYFPQLGLIQIALSDEECFAIDPIAVKDLTRLGELMASKDVVKILHDAPQDLSILQAATGAIAQNIFDTRLAAGFAGLSSTCSLGQLIKDLLDTCLNKSETRTNWLKRPLTDEQLSYALDDVRYLRAARVILLEQVIGPKVKTWLQEELSQLSTPDHLNKIQEHKRYKKLKGVNKLDREGLAIAKEICIWREQKAKEIDRPRGHILKDDVVMDIATAKPDSEELLDQTTISAKALERYSADLLKTISNTKSIAPEDFPVAQQRLQLTATEKKAHEQLKRLITLKGDVLGIDPPLLGNTNELKGYIKTIHSGKARQMRQTLGWRKEFLRDFYQLHREHL